MDKIEGLNPGITKLVNLLREANFNTVDSGDGETHDFECDQDYGYITIESSKENFISETERLVQFLTDIGIKLSPISDENPCVQSSYDPLDQSFIICVMNIHDKLLPQYSN